MKTILVLCLFFMSTVAVASDGDKINNPWQPVNPEVVIIWVPNGIIEDCALMDMPEQSGASYLCNQVVSDDKDED